MHNVSNQDTTTFQPSSTTTTTPQQVQNESKGLLHKFTKLFKSDTTTTISSTSSHVLHPEDAEIKIGVAPTKLTGTKSTSKTKATKEGVKTQKAVRSQGPLNMRKLAKDPLGVAFRPSAQMERLPLPTKKDNLSDKEKMRVDINIALRAGDFGRRADRLPRLQARSAKEVYDDPKTKLSGKSLESMKSQKIGKEIKDFTKDVKSMNTNLVDYKSALSKVRLYDIKSKALYALNNNLAIMEEVLEKQGKDTPEAKETKAKLNELQEELEALIETCDKLIAQGPQGEIEATDDTEIQLNKAQIETAKSNVTAELKQNKTEQNQVKLDKLEVDKALKSAKKELESIPKEKEGDFKDYKAKKLQLKELEKTPPKEDDIPAKEKFEKEQAQLKKDIEKLETENPGFAKASSVEELTEKYVQLNTKLETLQHKETTCEHQLKTLDEQSKLEDAKLRLLKNPISFQEALVKLKKAQEDIPKAEGLVKAKTQEVANLQKNVTDLEGLSEDEKKKPGYPSKLELAKKNLEEGTQGLETLQKDLETKMAALKEIEKETQKAQDFEKKYTEAKDSVNKATYLVKDQEANVKSIGGQIKELQKLPEEERNKPENKTKLAELEKQLVTEMDKLREFKNDLKVKTAGLQQLEQEIKTNVALKTDIDRHTNNFVTLTVKQEMIELDWKIKKSEENPPLFAPDPALLQLKKENSIKLEMLEAKDKMLVSQQKLKEAELKDVMLAKQEEIVKGLTTQVDSAHLTLTELTKTVEQLELKVKELKAGNVTGKELDDKETELTEKQQELDAKQQQVLKLENELYKQTELVDGMQKEIKASLDTAKTDFENADKALHLADVKFKVAQDPRNILLLEKKLQDAESKEEKIKVEEELKAAKEQEQTNLKELEKLIPNKKDFEEIKKQLQISTAHLEPRKTPEIPEEIRPQYNSLKHNLAIAQEKLKKAETNLEQWQKKLETYKKNNDPVKVQANLDELLKVRAEVAKEYQEYKSKGITDPEFEQTLIEKFRLTEVDIIKQNEIIATINALTNTVNEGSTAKLNAQNELRNIGIELQTLYMENESTINKATTNKEKEAKISEFQKVVTDAEQKVISAGQNIKDIENRISQAKGKIDDLNNSVEEIKKQKVAVQLDTTLANNVKEEQDKALQEKLNQANAQVRQLTDGISFLEIQLGDAKNNEELLKNNLEQQQIRFGIRSRKIVGAPNTGTGKAVLNDAIKSLENQLELAQIKEQKILKQIDVSQAEKLLKMKESEMQQAASNPILLQPQDSNEKLAAKDKLELSKRVVEAQTDVVKKKKDELGQLDQLLKTKTTEFEKEFEANKVKGLLNEIKLQIEEEKKHPTDPEYLKLLEQRKTELEESLK